MKTATRLNAEDRELVEAARETADRLYLEDAHEAAAALRTRSKETFTGIHIEASVGYADICGEVAAISHAVAHGHREFEAIVAISRDADGNHRLLSPCGRCRDVISDFSGDTWVIVGSLEEPYKVRVSELLPLRND